MCHPGSQGARGRAQPAQERGKAGLGAGIPLPWQGARVQAAACWLVGRGLGIPRLCLLPHPPKNLEVGARR